jgi:hypothetical protein
MPLFPAEADQIDDWCPGPAGVRDAVLDSCITVTDLRDQKLPPEAMECIVSENELEGIVAFAQDAVEKGRFINFGHWSNDAIQRGGKRAGPLWNQSVLALPFIRPWMFMHTWDPREAQVQARAERELGIPARPSRAAAVYLVVPDGSQAGGGLWLCELLPLKFSGVPMLELGDRCLLHVGCSDGDHRYECTSAPAMARFLIADKIPGTNPAADAAANVLDPCMLALLMLNTRGVERRTIAFADKLQRARARSGKPPLPPYDEVMSAPYITALTLSGRDRHRGEDHGGSHRSPTPHIRMGHTRQYASGVTTLIADTLVGVPPEQRAKWKSGRRSHYEVR